MSDETDNQHDDSLALQEAKPKLKRPPMYKVILINDDYTPMEFVVHILEVFSPGTESRRRALCWRYIPAEKVSAEFTRMK